MTGELSAIEISIAQQFLGAGATPATVLADVVGELIGLMSASGYNVNTDGSIPDQSRRHVKARTRFLWLSDLPGLKDDALLFKSITDGNTAALKFFDDIGARKIAIEDPAGTVAPSANWNSRNRLVLRTEPTPTVPQQLPANPITSGNANPNAPAS
ncbi:MAG: hypothetical protein KGL39_53855 [Patescibacteria group bacterium]|nr:hypothetical protein [Patescibacteria group bacterium]